MQLPVTMGFVAVLVFLTLFAVSEAGAVAKREGATPNIVVFLADDLGIGDVGCFGNTSLRTPNIDKIAEEGVKLNHNIAAAAVCTPSRAAFLTGRYPIRLGMVPTHILRVNLFTSSISGIPEDATTFAEVAQEQGYKTGLIGKWHLGVNCGHSFGWDYCHHPNNKGFDYFYGLPLTNIKDFGDDGQGVFFAYLGYQLNTYLTAMGLGGVFFLFCLWKLKYIRGVVLFLSINLLLFPLAIFYFIANYQHMINGILMKNYDVVEQPINLYDSLAQKLVWEGEGFLENRARDREPFVLFMSWIQAHTALHSSNKFKYKSKHGRYGDEVEELDWSVGQIMKKLEELGFKDDTLVYFTSDNGGHVEEKNLYGKREGGYNGIYRGGKAQGGMDGGIRVPTVAMWPKQIPAKTEISVPTSQMDLFPTLAAIWQYDTSEIPAMDGQNIYPLLTGRDKTPPHQFMFHYCGTSIHAARYTPADGRDVFKVHYATPNWVPGTEGCGYICNCNKVTWHDPPLLFNIAKDPSESRPLLLDAPEHKEVVDLLGEAVKNHSEGVAPVANQYHPYRMWPRPWYLPCCNFPYCQCSDPARLKAKTRVATAKS